MLSLCLATLLAAADVPVVSVMYFDNNTKDPELEFMGKGLTDLLITDLVAFDGIRVVERTRLQEVLKELDFEQTKYVDKKTAAKLGQVLSATLPHLRQHEPQPALGCRSTPAWSIARARCCSPRASRTRRTRSSISSSGWPTS